MTALSSGIHINVTLGFDGIELLKEGTKLHINRGERYFLLGRNGTGKTTLLSAIQSRSLPNFPKGFTTASMSQEDDLVGASAEEAAASVLDLVTLLARTSALRGLESEREMLEEELALPDVDASSVSDLVSRLSLIDDELSASSSSLTSSSCSTLLLRLGVPLSIQTSNTYLSLSGGMRQRVRLALALLSKPDLLCLDEPTNHLDIESVLWLESFLGGHLPESEVPVPVPPTLLVVSHDRSFISNLATSIISLKDQTLDYFPGTFEDYEIKLEEDKASHTKHLDARLRQESRLQSAVSSLRSRSDDPNSQKQAKQKAAKIERAGLFREDGKRYKLFSLKQMDAKSVRLPERAESIREQKDDAFAFPPLGPETRRSLGGPAGDAAVLSFDNVAAGYDAPEEEAPLPPPPQGAKNPFGGEKERAEAARARADASAKRHSALLSRAALRNVTAHLTLSSRIAVVGPNSAGKSTLLKLIEGRLRPIPGFGERRANPGLRIAYVAQDHTAELMRDVEARRPPSQKSGGAGLPSAAAYLSGRFGCTELVARTRLGKFGVRGDAAVLPMEELSGGQKARVSLTAITWAEPHILAMDEITNHLDIFARQALAAAIDAFDGGVIVISHDRGFCEAFCKELWIVEDGEIKHQLKTEKEEGGGDCGGGEFRALFERYASGEFGGAAKTQSSARRAGNKKMSSAAGKTMNNEGKRGTTAKGSVARTGMI